MKIVQVNSVCGSGSTGKICEEISKTLQKQKIENYILYFNGKSNNDIAIKCSNSFYIKVQAFKSKICGNYGFNSKISTLKLIKELERIQPDIIHIHNIHGHECHLTMLFNYIKKKNIKVLWTFHDCWSFTAYCPYFTMVRCESWKTGCYNCPQRKDTSWFWDRSCQMFNRKRKLFSDLDMTIVTPSKWLGNLVKESHLKKYPVKVINNGINLSIFKPTESNFREKHNIPDEKSVLLGVAFDWGKRKGLDVFIELAERLDKDKYQIVLVGTNGQIDKQLPDNIISIHRTQNQKELAEIYAVSDLFVNPTREENYPTVNMESIACGTPVLTFETGGSSEIIDETCGTSVPCDNVDELEKEIIRICNEKLFSEADCINRAKSFDMNARFEEYIQLYQKICKKNI